MAQEFRIALIGQAAFGESVLNALAKAGENIVGVFCPPDKNGKPDPLKNAADQHGIAAFQFKRMRASEAIAAFKGLNADLGVMAFVTDIVPEDILKAPRLGTIQYHPSLLPLHRGPSSINWPIIQGDAKTGLSIFWPDAGLDTGPILMQKETPIGPNDTLGSVYFDRLFPMGVEAMVESVALVKAGRAPKIQQDESKATYEGWCKAEQCVVDWSKPAQEVHNLIRGADPSPGASTIFKGSTIQLFGSTLTGATAAGQPGTLLNVGPNGLQIAATGGSVTVAKVKTAEGGKAAAADWATRAGLKPGDRLGV